MMNVSIDPLPIRFPNREIKYKHYYTGYCKDYVIYADLEAINKIRDEGSEGYNREVDKNVHCYCK